MPSASTGTPAGRPSRITTKPGPWDSPAVRKRNTRSSYGRVAGAARNGPPPRDRRPLPPWAHRRRLAGPYLFCATQSVKDSSPNRNEAQFPDTDWSRYCLLGPKVSPTDGWYTVVST